MTPSLRRAIARIEVRDDQGSVVSRGTGALVAGDLVLTALHVVADRRSQTLAPLTGTLWLVFPDHEVTATIEPALWDRVSDWALLRLAAPLADVRPIPLGSLEDGKPA